MGALFHCLINKIMLLLQRSHQITVVERGLTYNLDTTSKWISFNSMFVSVFLNFKSFVCSAIRGTTRTLSF